MRYLMCVLKENGQTVHDYTAVEPEDEDKISKLIQSRKLPDTFDFKGKRIVTDTILGFTDNPLAHEESPPTRPKITSFDELRQYVHQQKWYQKKYPRASQDNPQPSSEPIPLLEVEPKPDVPPSTDMTRF